MPPKRRGRPAKPRRKSRSPEENQRLADQYLEWPHEGVRELIGPERDWLRAVEEIGTQRLQQLGAGASEDDLNDHRRFLGEIRMRQWNIDRQIALYRKNPARLRVELMRLLPATSVPRLLSQALLESAIRAPNVTTADEVQVAAALRYLVDHRFRSPSDLDPAAAAFTDPVAAGAYRVQSADATYKLVQAAISTEVPSSWLAAFHRGMACARRRYREEEVSARDLASSLLHDLDLTTADSTGRHIRRAPKKR
jgi:hypothetical protein